MGEDKRYEAVKVYFEQGKIHTFYEIFERIPKTVVARDLNISSFTRLLGRLQKFRIEQIFEIAHLFERDEFFMVYFVYDQYKMNQQNKKNIK